MNLGIFRAFWMEHITRTWPFLLSGLFTAITFGGTIMSLVEHDIQDAVDGVLVVMLGISFIVQAIGLLYNGGFTESLSCRLPDATLRLPVSSGAIIFVRFVFNLVAIVGSTILLYMLLSYFETPTTTLWECVALLAALISILQLVALATSGTGDWAIGFLMATATIYLALHGRQYDDRFGSVIVVDWGVVAVAFLTTWAVLNFIRRGHGQYSFPMKKGIRPLNKPRRELRPFASARRAQIWFDAIRYWTPISRVFVVLSTMNVLFWLGGYPSPLYDVFVDTSDTPPFWVSTAAIALIPCAMLSTFVGGMFVSVQNRRLQLGSMAMFLYVRPMTTAQLAEARIIAALRVFIAPVVSVAIGFALYKYFAGDLQTAQNKALWSIVAPVTAVIWAAFWTWNLVGTGLLYASMGIVAILSPVVGKLNLGDGYVKICWGLAFALAIATYISVLRRRLVSLEVGVGLPLGVLVLMCGYILAMDVVEIADLLTFEFYFNGVQVYALLVAPVVTIPLGLHWCRHR